MDVASHSIARGILKYHGLSMIFSDSPSSWQELEQRVCQILEECGSIAERSKNLVLPRGTVTVDVHAVDKTREPSLIIICECKHWRTRVSQSVVHAFRTVVAESGAHLGLLISVRGFQSGAVNASASSNVELLSWDEFQARFYERWFESMTKKLAPAADEVFEYSDYFHDRTSSVLNQIPARVEELFDLHKRFSAYASATSYVQILKTGLRQFPIKIFDPRPGVTELRTLTVEDAREYFDILLASAQPAIEAYEDFIDKYATLNGTKAEGNA